MKTNKLLLATGNKDKIKEIKEILKDLDFQILSKDDFNDFPKVIEDKDTIEGNAIKKALEISEKYNLPTLADDTGFFVEALNGRPGVYAARYAGENCTYEDNRKKLLKELKDKKNRSAYFKTVVVLADKGKIIATATGKVTGKVAFEEKGEKGFGYDHLFIVDGLGKTFAELSAEEKHKISHRGIALKKMKDFIKTYFKKTNR